MKILLFSFLPYLVAMIACSTENAGTSNATRAIKVEIKKKAADSDFSGKGNPISSKMRLDGDSWTS